MSNEVTTKYEKIVGWLTVCVICFCIAAAGKFVGCVFLGSKMKIGTYDIIADVVIGTVVYFMINKERKGKDK